jgi:hypothetical protein
MNRNPTMPPLAVLHALGRRRPWPRGLMRPGPIRVTAADQEMLDHIALLDEEIPAIVPHGDHAPPEEALHLLRHPLLSVRDFTSRNVKRNRLPYLLRYHATPTEKREAKRFAAELDQYNARKDGDRHLGDFIGDEATWPAGTVLHAKPATDR